MIIRDDIILNSIENNRFVDGPYTITMLFDSGFIRPMAFFNGPNWMVTRRKIQRKYGLPDESVNYEGYIYRRLFDYFVDQLNKGNIENKEAFL